MNIGHDFENCPSVEGVRLYQAFRKTFMIEHVCKGSDSGQPPGPQKYVKQQPFGLLLEVLGHDFAYFWGPGSSQCPKSKRHS